jgi:hypothetical protein
MQRRIARIGAGALGGELGSSLARTGQEFGMEGGSIEGLAGMLNA